MALDLSHHCWSNGSSLGQQHEKLIWIYTPFANGSNLCFNGCQHMVTFSVNEKRYLLVQRILSGQQLVLLAHLL